MGSNLSRDLYHRGLDVARFQKISTHNIANCVITLALDTTQDEVCIVLTWSGAGTGTFWRKAQIEQSCRLERDPQQAVRVLQVCTRKRASRHHRDGVGNEQPPSWSSRRGRTWSCDSRRGQGHRGHRHA